MQVQFRYTQPLTQRAQAKSPFASSGTGTPVAIAPSLQPYFKVVRKNGEINVDHITPYPLQGETLQDRIIAAENLLRGFGLDPSKLTKPHLSLSDSRLLLLGQTVAGMTADEMSSLDEIVRLPGFPAGSFFHDNASYKPKN